jgi:hypothetical protein
MYEERNELHFPPTTKLKGRNLKSFVCVKLKN